MLNALSRIFQASSATETDASANRDEERASDEFDFPLDSGVHLERKPSSQMSVRVRASTPSHVSWKVPSPQPASPASHQDPTWGSQYDAHSASAPSLLLLNSPPGNTAQQRTSFRRHSSQSLRAHSLAASASDDSERRSNFEPPYVKPLSPIGERVHFPPLRQPSLDSIPLTPDSTRVHDGHNLSAYPGAFINRPLKRSVSQASTSTFLSTASVVPPTIPPLDFRPNFQNACGVQGRKSRLVVPTLPTVVGSPHPAKYSVIYEDGSSARTSSFITAPSEHIPEPETDANAGAAVHVRGYAGSSTEATPAVRTSGLPEGLYDVDLTADHELRIRTDTMHASSMQPLLGGPIVIPRRPRSAWSSDSESHILQRWLKGVSFGSDRFSAPAAKRKQLSVSLACILFWLGFIGPWCWLFGGWLLSNGGEIMVERKHAEPVLPRWMRHGKRRHGLSEGDQRKLLALKFWYPLVAPSVESLSPSVHSHASVTSAREIRRGGRQGVDPWVNRCRIAAIMSGVLVLALFVVALIVVASRP